MAENNITNGWKDMSRTDCVSRPIPDDIDTLLVWANVTRRLAQLADQNRNGLIESIVVVGYDGKPAVWAARTHKLEPKFEFRVTEVVP